MSMSLDRRTQKRLATRQNISNVATRLFLERGFDRVTIDEIAAAANVGRMTIFNHFPRKEDMFFDREKEGLDALSSALARKKPGCSPLEAIRQLAHELIEQHSPLVAFSPVSQTFVAAIERSEALKSRARAIRDEFTHHLAQALAADAGREADCPEANLAASLILAIWSVALIQAHRTFRETQANAAANAVFLELIDRGFIGVQAAMSGTPYCFVNGEGKRPSSSCAIP